MFVTPAYAQTGAGGPDILVSVLPFILIFVIMYMLIIRPQRQQMKKRGEMLAAIRRGDAVVTGGGLVGKVTKVIDDMVARFEKENSDIKVTAVYAGNYTDTMTKAMTAMKGGQPPQLSVLLSTDVFTLMDENAIVPMDDLVADKAWFKTFYPAFMANGQIGGKTWSIPFQRSTIVLYWNKDAFKDAGLDPEKPPATWDEMASMGARL